MGLPRGGEGTLFRRGGEEGVAPANPGKQLHRMLSIGQLCHMESVGAGVLPPLGAGSKVDRSLGVGLATGGGGELEGFE